MKSPLSACPAVVRSFFDRNVIVDALRNEDSLKRDRALALIERHAASRTLVFSTQVLMESFNVLVGKRGLPRGDALAGMRLRARYEVIAPSATDALDALQIS